MLVSDAPRLFEMRSDPRVMAFIPRPMSRSVEDAEALVRTIEADIDAQRSLIWAMAEKVRPEDLIGTVGFHRTAHADRRSELGYAMLPAYWGRGLMSEAVAAVIPHGFDVLGFHRISAITDPRNAASNALLLRHGFKQEGHLREDLLHEGRFLDSLIFGLLRSDR